MSTKIYKDLDSFIEGEAELVRLLSAAHLKEDFIRYKLESKEPPYDASLLLDLYQQVRRDKLDDLFQSDSPKEGEMSATDPQFRIDVLDELGRTAQIEAFDMMLLLFTPEFATYVSNARDVLGIPKEGFKNWEARSDHFKKLDKDWSKRFGKSKGTHLAADLLLLGISEYIQKKTIFDDAEPGRAHLLFSMIFDYITINDAFYALEYDKDDDLSPKTITAVRIPIAPKRFRTDSIDIMVAVFPTTTKEEAKAAIDKHWHTVEKLREKLPVLPPRQRLKKTASAKLVFQVYSAYISGKNYKQISNQLQVGEAHARRMVSDTKKRINQLRKM